MKRNLLLITVCLLAVMAMSCASNKTQSNNSSRGSSVDSRPQAVINVMNNPPNDSLIGIGVANMATLNQNRTISATRARAALSRQMDVILRDMVRDYTAGSEVDHSASLAFQENITVQLSQSRLQGSSITGEYEDDRGRYWTIVMLNKTGVVNEINQVVAAAKLRIPAMASFNAEERMNAALFDRYFKDNQVGYSDRD